MGLYIIVEGRRTEPQLLRAWLPVLLPNIREVVRVEDADLHSYLMICGHGYPHYLNRVRDAVADLREFRFDWLLVFADAEERSAAERAQEIEEVIHEANCPVPFAVFVADCCIESWLLGNRGAFRRAELTPELKRHRDHYDVVIYDPEKMPAPGAGPGRVAYHFDYLQALLRAMGRSYTKRHAGETASETWFDELCRRARASDSMSPQMESFGRMVDFFERLRVSESG